MTRIAVLSDLHISPPGPLSSFHAGEELAGLLGRLRSEHAVDTLVLAGDVFDFLALPGAEATMRPERVPAFVDGALGEIAKTGWGKKLLGAVGEVARAGAKVVVIPGNHDPELAHPEVPAILRARCGLAADDARLAVYLEPGPWRATAGTLEVIVGHGHRGDPWNDIDPATVLHHATMNPPLPLELPLGSRLVVGAMRAFREKYAFVDALKPEAPGVPLMLLYLDPVLAMKHLPGAVKLGGRAFIAKLQRRLRRGPTLTAGEAAGTAAAGEAAGTAAAGAAAAGTSRAATPPPPDDLDRITGALLGLEPEERTEGNVTAIEDWLSGHRGGAAGTLASHGGGKCILRAALRLLGRGGIAFDQTQLDKDDQAIIAEHLPAGCGPRIVIAGHTHAARYKQFDAERTYINTGTWSDLIPWPPLGTDEEARQFVDKLEANEVPPLRRLTWALVDEAGGRLMQ